MRMYIKGVLRWVGQQDEGQDLLEYGLLAALIAVVALGAVEVFGNTVNDTLWEAIDLALSGAGFGRVGLGASILGVLIGVACMMPGHLFGATGAGDVKLLGAAGALLGPVDIVKAFIGTAIAGGLVALVVALQRGRLKRTFESVARLLSRREVEGSDATVTDRRFAYAPAIAIGVIASVFAW